MEINERVRAVGWYFSQQLQGDQTDGTGGTGLEMSVAYDAVC
jgi:hypothetical protein